jgi:hypothetical protein
MKYKQKKEATRIFKLIAEKIYYLIPLLLCVGLLIAFVATYGEINSYLGLCFWLSALWLFCDSLAGLLHKSKYSKENCSRQDKPSESIGKVYELTRFYETSDGSLVFVVEKKSTK